MKNDNICLHTLFETMARTFPDKTAVICGESRVTYGELDSRAQAIAIGLSDRVQQPGQVVGILMARSVNLVATIVGILKSGAAFLPLDPEWPTSRVRDILSDSDAVAVVTDGQHDLGAAGAVPMLEAETLIGRPTTDARRRATVQPAATDLAYVIYTSGSTGQPKGVMIEHRNVSRLFSQSGPMFGFGADTVSSVIHSFSFDFSVWELWSALLYGGTAVLVSDGEASDPTRVAQLLEDNGVTMLSVTPSNFSLLAKVAIADGRRFPALKCVVLGGERLDASHLRRWQDHYGDRIDLINMYGITETTVHVTYHRLRRDSISAGQPVAIGVPLPDLAVHLLDDDGAPVADGKTGEIAVSGSGLARGYLKQPDLTRARFSMLPLGPGGEPVRVYLSGDLACRRDGVLFYEGRKDDQVKVRGFRVELGEVESAIAVLPGVETCAVVKQRLDDADSRLVAFVVVNVDIWPGTQAASKACADVLPAYMCPSVIREVDRLPVTANGKVDRHALSLLLEASAQETLAPPPGNDEVIDDIVKLGREILKLRDINLRDDLFDQGATSLSVVRLLLSVNARFGTRLSGTDLNGDSSLANIASLVSGRIYNTPPTRMLVSA